MTAALAVAFVVLKTKKEAVSKDWKTLASASESEFVKEVGDVVCQAASTALGVMAPNYIAAGFDTIYEICKKGYNGVVDVVFIYVRNFVVGKIMESAGKLLIKIVKVVPRLAQALESLKPKGKYLPFVAKHFLNETNARECVSQAADYFFGSPLSDLVDRSLDCLANRPTESNQLRALTAEDGTKK